jgi:hypothetical protein
MRNEAKSILTMDKGSLGVIGRGCKSGSVIILIPLWQVSSKSKSKVNKNQ